MDNATEVTSRESSRDVLAGAVDLIVNTGKKLTVVENARGKALAYIAAIGGTSELMAAPKGDASKEVITLRHPTSEAVYDTSPSGMVICSFADGDDATIDVTKRQFYAAVKVAIVNGLSANEIKAFEGNRDKVKMPQSIADLVTPTSKKVGSRISDFKARLLAREGEQIMDDLQAAEDKAAESEGRPATDVRKTAQEASKRTGKERLLAGLADLTRIASNDEKPDDYSVVAFKAWISTGYTVLNHAIPVEDDGSK